MGTKRYQFKTGSKCRTCLNNVNGSNQKKKWKYLAGIATYYRSKYKSVFSLGANCDAVSVVAIIKAAFQLRVFYTYVHARKNLNPIQYYI